MMIANCTFTTPYSKIKNLKIFIKNKLFELQCMKSDFEFYILQKKLASPN